MSNVLEIIPLGGIGEFGMNCMAVRYGDEMLILDAGMGFPEESAYGVDISIPNFGFSKSTATTLLRSSSRTVTKIISARFHIS